MSDELRDLAAAWYYREHFGFVAAPPRVEPQAARRMAVCLLSIANGDGELSDAERSWALGYFAAKGYPTEVIDEARRLTDRDLDVIPALMELGVLKPSGRILLYDAIRVASADGYHPAEMRAVRAVARALGVPDAAVAEIEALVADEAALPARRIQLLMPDGHPCLGPAQGR
jgi:tellurite resistance protein